MGPTWSGPPRGRQHGEETPHDASVRPWARRLVSHSDGGTHLPSLLGQRVPRHPLLDPARRRRLEADPQDRPGVLLPLPRPVRTLLVRPAGRAAALVTAFLPLLPTPGSRLLTTCQSSQNVTSSSAYQPDKPASTAAQPNGINHRDHREHGEFLERESLCVLCDLGG